MKGHYFYWFIIGPIFIAGVFTWLWTQGEATGTVQSRPQAVVEEAPVEPAPYVYQSQYLTFQVPEKFQEATHTLPESGPLKETLFLVRAGGGNNEKIALSVEEREEKMLSASPSYQMRQSNPLYTEQLSKDERESFLTKETDPFELTYFFFVDEFLVSLTYSASVPNDGDKTMLDAVKESIQKTGVKDTEKSPESLQ